MFASVDARKKYKRWVGSPGDQDVQHNDKVEQTLSENPVPKLSRSLVTRRIHNLTAILNVSLLRRDHKRAQRAFSLLLRCERHGVNLSTLWELGLEVLLQNEGLSKDKAEEFLGRVRLTSSDVGRHPTTEKQMVDLFAALLVVEIRQGKFKHALDELNNELLNRPYSQSMALRHYASMLAQFVAREQQEGGT